MPSVNKIGWAKSTRGLEECKRKLHPMWHFRSEERTFITDKFRPNSSFNPRIKGNVVVVWDREDYLKDAYAKCEDTKM